MAIAKGAVLGFLGGKLGQIVAKTREGKQYYASMPSKYTMCMKPYEVDKRNQFSVNGKIARIIYEDELLNNLWKKSIIPANNGFNKITKINFHLCGTDRPSEENLITPPEGFILSVTNLESLPDGVCVNLVPIDLNNDESGVIFKMYISFYEPLNGAATFFNFSKIEKYETQGTTLTFRFSESEKYIAEMYRNRTVYLCAVTVDDDNKVVRFSQTTGKDL